MNRHAQSRATILQAEGIIPYPDRRQGRRRTIAEQDYAAVPPPQNLQVHPAGNCLVWLWSMNSSGYGISSFPGGEQLAHRQAFTQSRKHTPKHSVLHLCHRPFCIQPSHLYDGSAKQNSEDRKIRISEEFDFNLFNQKSDIVQTVAKYLWKSPRGNKQKPLLISPIEHECDFIVPAMDRRICPTCGRDNQSKDEIPFHGGAYQPANDAPNVAHISRSSRSFRDLASGITIQMNGTTDYSIPRTRAERRRREKAARKSPYRDKPILLGSTRVAFKPGETTHFEMKMDDFQATGPGMVLLVAQPIGHNTEGPTKPSKDSPYAAR